MSASRFNAVLKSLEFFKITKEYRLKNDDQEGKIVFSKVGLYKTNRFATSLFIDSA